MTGAIHDTNDVVHHRGLKRVILCTYHHTRTKAFISHLHVAMPCQEQIAPDLCCVRVSLVVKFQFAPRLRAQSPLPYEYRLNQSLNGVKLFSQLLLVTYASGTADIRAFYANRGGLQSRCARYRQRGPR